MLHIYGLPVSNLHPDIGYRESDIVILLSLSTKTIRRWATFASLHIRSQSVQTLPDLCSSNVAETKAKVEFCASGN